MPLPKRAQRREQIARQQAALALPRGDDRPRAHAGRRRGTRPPTRWQPCASSAAMTPVSTSPMPPDAMPGLPHGQTSRRPSGSATRLPAPFSTTTAAIALRQLARGGKAIALDRRRWRRRADAPLRPDAASARSARELARLARQQVQPVGIEHQRLARIQRGQPQRMAPGAPAPDPARAPARWRARASAASACGPSTPRAISSGRAAFSANTCSPRVATLTRPAPAAQRRLAGQPHRAGHAVIAADHQHVAEVALVGVARARRQRARRASSCASGGDVGVDAVRHVQRWPARARRRDRPRRPVMQAALAGDEGDRGIGADRRAGAACRCRHPARRARRAPAPAGRCALTRSISARGIALRARGRGRCRTARRRAHRPRATSLAHPTSAPGRRRLPTPRAPRAASPCERRVSATSIDLQPGLARQHAEQETVAAVVAGAAVDARSSLQLRPMPAQAVRMRRWPRAASARGPAMPQRRSAARSIARTCSTVCRSRLYGWAGMREL